MGAKEQLQRRQQLVRQKGCAECIIRQERHTKIYVDMREAYDLRVDMYPDEDVR